MGPPPSWCWCGSWCWLGERPGCRGGLVLVAVFLDVLVEGAAGEGHEHGLEGRRLAVVPRDHLLEPLRRVLGDHATPVEDRDAAAEALRLGQVVRREDDRRLVLGVDLLDER